ncbi:GM22827 [Drosophila sechellia]|uniref:GM22827 n=1 Tax=Drosophila sechellia TaxID=7238 RepID=B4IPR5_DROSE|nr:GM22827 [Drosophila sechellia]
MVSACPFMDSMLSIWYASMSSSSFLMSHTGPSAHHRCLGTGLITWRLVSIEDRMAVILAFIMTRMPCRSSFWSVVVSSGERCGDPDGDFAPAL